MTNKKKFLIEKCAQIAYTNKDERGDESKLCLSFSYKVSEKKDLFLFYRKGKLIFRGNSTERI